MHDTPTPSPSKEPEPKRTRNDHAPLLPQFMGPPKGLRLRLTSSRSLRKKGFLSGQNRVLPTLALLCGLYPTKEVLSISVPTLPDMVWLAASISATTPPDWVSANSCWATG
jgi:hypothetical protein